MQPLDTDVNVSISSVLLNDVYTRFLRMNTNVGTLEVIFYCLYGNEEIIRSLTSYSDRLNNQLRT